MSVARDCDLPLFVMGDGSNMLFDSRGFRGIVLRIGPGLDALAFAGTRVTAGAGIWVPAFARQLALRGLAGLEHVVGIPGRLGGLVVMNGGSQRKGIGTHVRHVTVVTRDGESRTLAHADLGYSYRTSALQGSGAIVTDVVLELEPGDRGVIMREMIEILASRRRKFPKNLPNCGSTFLSNPAMYDKVGPPGQAIEAAGLKGVAIGGAQVSPLHANFIVNRGGATSDEVLALIALVRGTVQNRTGFAMDCEVRHLTESGEERPAHEFTDAGRFDRSLLDRIDRSDA
ncbi:UDP-N-acetylenolpyruvoylglucosamine reductase [Rhodovulum sp. P5]|nr:UDP-N-acetylenolpyruvoylglucosamine reductase [Rhodovulum sp. P5]